MTSFKEEFCAIIPNRNIEPSFIEGNLVILKKDYTEIHPAFSPYLTEGAFCIIIKCGLSKYPCNHRTGDVINQTDGEELCFVHAIEPLVDPENDTDYVKAEDLELYPRSIRL